MATRNQVLSLFGASPQQILEQRRREDAMSVLKQQDPFARAGGAIGLGLARMFGGEPAEVARQRELFGQLEGVNFENPEQMRAAAATLASQFPDKALQLITMADSMETSQQRRSSEQKTEEYRQAQIEEIGRKADRVKVPTIVKQEITDITGGTKVSYRISEIEVDKDQAPEFLEKFKTVYGLASSDPSATIENDSVINVPDDAPKFKTSVGASIAVLGENQYALLDKDGKGVRLLTEEELKQLGGAVKPTEETKEEKTQTNLPQSRKTGTQRNIIKPVVVPSTRGQNKRNRK